jgi:hypothetical protein
VLVAPPLRVEVPAVHQRANFRFQDADLVVHRGEDATGLVLPGVAGRHPVLRQAAAG